MAIMLHDIVGGDAQCIADFLGIVRFDIPTLGVHDAGRVGPRNFCSARLYVALKSPTFDIK